ncbi:MAG: hypothetical protein Q8R04_03795 [Nanoarchaeota archaeon]|nr:hypothetical protein [Nanoarchaeota archaeon]
MVKIIGLILILSGVISLIIGTLIDLEHDSTSQPTGNVVLNILTQPYVPVSFFDYLEAITFSYSIISFMMGAVFLLRI